MQRRSKFAVSFAVGSIVVTLLLVSVLLALGTFLHASSGNSSCNFSTTQDSTSYTYSVTIKGADGSCPQQYSSSSLLHVVLSTGAAQNPYAITIEQTGCTGTCAAPSLIDVQGWSGNQIFCSTATTSCTNSVNSGEIDASIQSGQACGGAPLKVSFNNGQGSTAVLFEAGFGDVCGSTTSSTTSQASSTTTTTSSQSSLSSSASTTTMSSSTQSTTSTTTVLTTSSSSLQTSSTTSDTTTSSSPTASTSSTTQSTTSSPASSTMSSITTSLTTSTESSSSTVTESTTATESSTQSSTVSESSSTTSSTTTSEYSTTTSVSSTNPSSSTTEEQTTTTQIVQSSSSSTSTNACMISSGSNLASPSSGAGINVSMQPSATLYALVTFFALTGAGLLIIAIPRK